MLKEVRAMLDEMAAMGAIDITTVPLKDARAGYGMMMKLSDGPPRDIARVEDMDVPGGAVPVPIRLYDPTPDATAAGPAMVFVHGGGFVIGDRDSYDSLCRHLSDGLQMPVISVDYRLAPEHPFPAAVDDSIAATQWASDKLAGVLGRPVDGLVVCGDSAGGNLAGVLAQHFRAGLATPIKLQVLMYPVADMVDPAQKYDSYTQHGSGKLLEKPAMDFFMNAYVPKDADRADPRLSVLHGDLEGLAPAIVIVAEYDPLHDEGIAYAMAMRKAGNQVVVRDEGGQVHGMFTLRGKLPASMASTEALIADIKAQLGAL